MYWEDRVDLLEGVEQHVYLKAIMTAAAQMVRAHLQDWQPENPQIRSQVFNSLARVIWIQGVAPAQTLLDRSEFARKHIFFESNAPKHLF